jgi:hypothetical protein
MKKSKTKKKSKKTLEYEQDLKIKARAYLCALKTLIDENPCFLNKESLNYNRIAIIHILFKNHYSKVYMHVSKDETETDKKYMRREIKKILNKLFLDVVFLSDNDYLKMINLVIGKSMQFSEVADHPKSCSRCSRCSRW